MNHSMNAALCLTSIDSFALAAAQRASERIAPVWPLDKSVAVNPWWEWRDRHISQVAAHLGSLRNVRLLMPKAYYLRQWQSVIRPHHLILAARELGVTASPEALVDYLSDMDRLPQWKNLSDWLDEMPEQANKMPWCEEITHQISQSCGLFFSYPDHRPAKRNGQSGFYGFWRDIIRQDAGLAILMDTPELHGFFLSLPDAPADVIRQFYQELEAVGVIDETGFESYCLALLLDINGWSAVFAQPDQAALVKSSVIDLLAARMAWEWALWWRLGQRPDYLTIRNRFVEQFTNIALREASCYSRLEYTWVWQRALELSVQNQFAAQLTGAEFSNPAAPALQAVFCIDVRSEPMRRALESVSPDIQTFGFAGFFGLPIEYQPFASKLRRPQLPALLKPSLSARPLILDDRRRRQVQPLLRRNAASHTGHQAFSTFGWVEAQGVFDGLRLIAQSFGRSHKTNPLNTIDQISGWQLWRGDECLSPEDTAKLLAGVLGHMGLTHGFAKRVLLVAHGSCTANNPLAANLDCGACGGQSGEVNVRVLAYFLNQQYLRVALADHGIEIPESTQFVPCLHNTTSDDIQCLHSPEETSRMQDETWQLWLKAASERARSNRAEAVGVKASTPEHQRLAFTDLTRDWGQLRPEWGLANNAAFIVAPRAATRRLDFNGRAFLHDYRWQTDTNFATLELILTAPMIVTHWINLQYFASMTDNQHYGSGNKLLHNVVGGNLGVFEGNGGDLRIGLPLQSLHDGNDWRHQPVRLNVFLDAPRHAITPIIQRHTHVANLVNNEWLYLFQWDREERRICRYFRGKWQAMQNVELSERGEF